MYDTLKILGLGLGASERVVKRQVPSSLNAKPPGQVGSCEIQHTIAQSTEHFQLLNNARRTFVKLFETKMSIFLLYEHYSLMLVIHGAKA